MQFIQDELLFKDIGKHKVLDSKGIPPPLDAFKRGIGEAKEGPDSTVKMSSRMKVDACMRDMYHYARVCRLHVLECVMDTALSAVKTQKIEEVSNVRLQSYLLLNM